jgi:Glycosyltransferase sugar-binding region containing DXD motif
MIPATLVRTVPEHTRTRQETFWNTATQLHPQWKHITYRDPVDRKLFPITSPYWNECETGAQLADLIRTESLFIHGGVYIDSDIQCFQPFDTLLGLPAFVGWEDTEHICNAVMGFPPGHIALYLVMELALQRRKQGTWHAGIGAFTEIIKDREDVVRLPPSMFYPAHWRGNDPTTLNARVKQNPWAYCVHHWEHSWK